MHKWGQVNGNRKGMVTAIRLVIVTTPKCGGTGREHSYENWQVLEL